MADEEKKDQAIIDEIKLGRSTLDKLRTNFNNEVGEETEFAKFYKKAQRIDVNVMADSESRNKLKALQENIDERKKLINNTGRSFNTIAELEKQIKHLDEKNLKEIDACLRICNVNGAQDISKTTRALNTLATHTNINKDIQRAMSQGDTGTERTALKIIGYWNTGKRYLSGDSLTQMYQAVKKIHGNISDINGLVSQRNTEWNNAKSYDENYRKLQQGEFEELKEAQKSIKEQLVKDQDKILQSLKEFHTKFRTDFTNVMNNLHAQYKDKKLNRESIMENIKKLREKLAKYETEEINKVYSLDMRDYFKEVSRDIDNILELFTKKGDSLDFGKIKKSIEYIERDIKKNIDEQANVFVEIARLAKETV